MTEIKGISLSNGFALGHICRIKEVVFSKESHGLSFSEASDVMRKKIEEAEKSLATFKDAYLMVLDDEELKGTIEDLVSKGSSEEEAVNIAFDLFADRVENSNDMLISSRSKDIRLLKKDIKLIMKNNSSLPPQTIVCKSTVSPTFLLAESENIVGIITENGGINDHTAIIARMKGIPYISGVDISNFDENDEVIVDASNEVIIINPDERIKGKYLKTDRQRRINPVVRFASDRMTVLANVSDDFSVSESISKEFAGIGLLRLEMFYMAGDNLLSEDELVKYISDAARPFEGKTVRVRALDIGKDKCLDRVILNNAAKLRGLKLLLHNESVLTKEIQAVKKCGKNIEFLLPYVEDKEDIEKAVELIKNQGFEGKIGIMTETKKGIDNLDDLLPFADYVSIGTNDLTEDLLGISRSEGKIVMSEGDKSIMTSALETIVYKCHNQGKTVCVCGEMASDMFWMEIFAAIGIDEISVRMWE